MQGIYQIKNVITGKVYVGSSSGIKGRWSNHKSDLSRGVHDNSMLQRSYNKHGFEAFEFSILETVSNEADLIEREQHWIDCLQAANRDHGYNLSPLAGSTRGRKHTEESKRKMSEAKKGQPSAMKGKQHTDDAKRLMSLAKKGKDTWMKGKKHTEESKRKSSLSHLETISIAP
jgi:group I intron endonuclease